MRYELRSNTPYIPNFVQKSNRSPIDTIGISENDLWIAATVLRHSLTLVSSDSDFERMRQVREISWESWV
ncbi:PIN domain-containing protein [Nostoc sp.]|uniref:PIN domain-containing protein n=1 Tax=Nostoc sp. TaxID=1180 RepID=UPI002FF4DDBB